MIQNAIILTGDSICSMVLGPLVLLSPCPFPPRGPLVKKREVSKFHNSPDSESYWGCYFKYRKRCLCLGAGSAARCRHQMCACALWSLSAGAARVPLPDAYIYIYIYRAWMLVPRCRSWVLLRDVCGCVHFAAWLLVPLQVPLLWCCPQIFYS